MDGTQFDTLIKRLGTRPLTRLTALRGLAASVAALVGVTLAAEPGAAKNKRKVCHCTDEKSTSCKTLEVGKKAARKHVRKHACDYSGKCENFSGCCFSDTLSCTTNAQCCSGFCGDGICRPSPCANLTGACSTDQQCCSGFCGDGICRPAGSCLVLTTTCTTSGQCCSGNCQLSACQICKSNGTSCGAASECCSGNCSTTCL